MRKKDLTNPYQFILDSKLDGDYIRQDSVVELMQNYALLQAKNNAVCTRITKCKYCKIIELCINKKHCDF